MQQLNPEIPLPKDQDDQLNEQIRFLAYHFWLERGCPIGTPEIDWFNAEEDLRRTSEDTTDDSLLVTAAKKIGSAVGSVAGIVSSFER